MSSKPETLIHLCDKYFQFHYEEYLRNERYERDIIRVSVWNNQVYLVITHDIAMQIKCGGVFGILIGTQISFTSSKAKFKFQMK